MWNFDFTKFLQRKSGCSHYDKLKNDNENICLDNDVDCDDVLNDFLQKRNFSEVWDRRKQACKTDRSLQRPWQHGTSGDTWRRQSLYFPWKLDLSLWTRNQCLQTWKSGLSSLVPKRSWDRQQKVVQAFHPGKKLCENVVRNLTLGYTVKKSTIKRYHAQKFPWNQFFSNFFSKTVDLTGKNVDFFRETIVFIKEITKELIWRNIFLVRWE